MTRRRLVGVIALVYMGMGFLNFFSSLLTTVSPAGLFVIRVFPLVGGALAFYAGLSMFSLSEFGRKLVILLLVIRVAINTVLLWWLPKNGAWLGVENRLGEIIYTIESPYAYPGFLLVLIVVSLLTIIFLSHKETKEIFVLTATSEIKPEIILEE
jgi:hypothetical protein